MLYEVITKDKIFLQIFPNPANECVSVYIPENNNTETLEIYTITGSLLKTFAVNSENNKISLKDISYNFV